MHDDKCLSCNTAATFKLSDKSYGCKCTYEFEEEIDRLNEQLIQKGYNLGYADGLAHGKLEGADEAEERILKIVNEHLIPECPCKGCATGKEIAKTIMSDITYRM